MCLDIFEPDTLRCILRDAAYLKIHPETVLPCDTFSSTEEVVAYATYLVNEIQHKHKITLRTAPRWDIKARNQELRDNARIAGWPRRLYPREAQIKILVAHNPRRGTARLRFALYRDGMTVGEYLDSVVAIYPRFERQAMEDLSWNSGQGWINIV